MTAMPASREMFEARLRAIGAESLPRQAPVPSSVAFRRGRTPDEVRAWVINRYDYQSRIPMKDAAFPSRVTDPDLRRIWRRRIEDHFDRRAPGEGGIAHWLKLAEGVGLDPDDVASARGVLPATRLPGRLCSLRPRRAAPAGHRRLADRAFRAADPQGPHRRASGQLRLRQRCHARRFPKPPDRGTAGRGLRPDMGARPLRAQAEQDAAAAALVFKTDGALARKPDALWSAYVEPGRIPPGAWQPGEGLL